jgi:hypothetical protein
MKAKETEHDNGSTMRFSLRRCAGTSFSHRRKEVTAAQGFPAGCAGAPVDFPLLYKVKEQEGKERGEK